MDTIIIDDPVSPSAEAQERAIDWFNEQLAKMTPAQRTAHLVNQERATRWLSGTADILTDLESVKRSAASVGGK